MRLAGRRLVVGGRGLEVGGQRHLGVDDDRAAAGQAHDEVGPQRRAVGGAQRLLLGEVAALEHAGVLDAAPQLHLAPHAARLRLAQRVDERGRLAAELLGGAADAADLLAQLGLRAGALDLEPAQLHLDEVELLAQRPDEVLDGLALPGEVAVGLVARAGERAGRQALERRQQRLLVAAGQQAAGEQARGRLRRAARATRPSSSGAVHGRHRASRVRQDGGRRGLWVAAVRPAGEAGRPGP